MKLINKAAAEGKLAPGQHSEGSLESKLEFPKKDARRISKQQQMPT